MPITKGSTKDLEHVVPGGKRLFPMLRGHKMIVRLSFIYIYIYFFFFGNSIVMAY